MGKIRDSQKKMAVINDLSGFGRCSIAVELPIISAMKIQCCFVPTAVFSNHTGFPSFYLEDFTERMSPYMKEWEKLEKNLGGIRNMTRVPDAIFVVDPKKERICVQEAHALGITLIGIGDTNCDPEELDYIIPGNDDAIRAVKLIVSKMADAVIEANQGEAVYTEEEQQAAEAGAVDIEEIAGQENA